MRMLVCITGHGFGHAAQTAPVIRRLWQCLPRLEVIIRSSVPEAWLRSRIKYPFQYVFDDSDFGMEMATAVDVMAEQSARRYWRLHRDWSQAVHCETQRLVEIKPDVILTNIAYLPLAGAAQLSIPAFALCSLNWADIFQHYCSTQPHAAEVYAQMLQAYRSALCFLQCTPSMPMSTLHRTLPIQPIASLGMHKRAALDRQLGVASSGLVGMLAPGGITMDVPVEDWPLINGIQWIVQQGQAPVRSDMMVGDQLPFEFVDLLASCDYIVGKIGYGTVVECVCNQIPLLYVKRGDWPEEPYLIPWLHRYGRAQEISREQLMHGDFSFALSTLLEQSAKPAVACEGAVQAADAILTQLNAK